MERKKKKVIVGLSGGVDSSVAACMLVREGYEVLGLHLKVLQEGDGSTVLEPSPMTISSREEFHIPVFTLNLAARFRNEVMDYFKEEYLAARTPNPCMVCNKTIKWRGLLEGAAQLGADMVATGHYARTAFIDGRHRLFAGLDRKKDQSYFLWMLAQEELSRTILPLGGLTKPEVRDLARSFGLTAAEKKESQEICFVPDDDYGSYLESAVPGLHRRVEGGEILDPSGQVIGHHKGYPFYTIGQRRGLGTATGEPLYVTAIDPIGNLVHTGPKSALFSTSVEVSHLNWIGIDPPFAPMEATAKIRYRDHASPCTIIPLGPGPTGVTARIMFKEPKSALTPGQAAVFYRGEEVLGGGIIEGALPMEPHP
ncbi:tRNA 2-thiouridine(34) synthase MnmA [Pelodictyon luteolum]|uniref:tRNA-specific 2-thiouridylase MnmA n=1 Tax=Chlorobium luteolum (strain DSM 273 / BCRC 81028 / 2530) TaxID=319225 RepID=MNMA_CHLL3|nr:tRNA 2-thiouridine(34) synthase MnmA [Pelodictyon luteolum]Q3B625.1 RecName: Full=tRNA-specific 2-thiouridylase MnmA [Pelodictyon luteolum DSM 273]ABB23206.1 tRNA (5-methylaminomethyl-2-thiouridylate)-methyltransferase [Pelodictyon luteolum DSM 273]